MQSAGRLHYCRDDFAMTTLDNRLTSEFRQPNNLTKMIFQFGLLSSSVVGLVPVAKIELVKAAARERHIIDFN